jgi:hypothetical protein
MQLNHGVPVAHRKTNITLNDHSTHCTLNQKPSYHTFVA